MAKFKEGDVVRVLNWQSEYSVSSVMDRPQVVYIREINGQHKGYMNMKHLTLIRESEPTETNAQTTLF